jgi:hypothetical protein
MKAPFSTSVHCVRLDFGHIQGEVQNMTLGQFVSAKQINELARYIDRGR